VLRFLGCGLVLVLATVSGAASSRPELAMLPPPSFQPALDEWLTVTTGPTRHLYSQHPLRAIGIAPQVWALSVLNSDLSALQPYSLGTGLRRLSPGAVLIWASTIGRGGPTQVYTPGRWPLNLRSFRVDHTWETQPAANVQQRLRWTAVSGWRLDVRVYVATQHPSEKLLRIAQTELRRMRLP
jgi:hypothetical protein